MPGTIVLRTCSRCDRVIAIVRCLPWSNIPSAMVDQVPEFRRQAELARQLAATATLAEDKQHWIDLAETWDGLAAAEAAKKSQES